MTGPRLALFNPAGLPVPAGWDGTVCTLSRQLAALAPDLVVAADAADGKRTGHPWLGWLRDDPDRLRRDRRRLDAVLSHDGFLVEDAAQARFLADTLSATGRAAPILAPEDFTPDRLAGLLADIRATAGFTPAAAGPGVDYIVRVGGRDIGFVRRCLDSLVAQSAPGIGVILVRHGPVAGLEAEMERFRPLLRRLDLIDVPAPTTRSACLWAGLRAVAADLFGMLDDDDALHPNHVASLAPLALAGSVAIAGSVQVWDDAQGPVLPADPGVEHRAFHALPPPDRAAFLAWNLAVHSSAFLAPSFLLPALGPDPGLDFAEDTYLLRRLARAAPFASSWRVSTDFHWRQGGADNTAFRSDHRAEAAIRIADRERLDPVINALRATGAAQLPPVPAWGQPAARPDLPSLAGPADFHALPADRPLYVYGTGRGGRIVLGEIAKHGHLSVTGLLDSQSTGTAFGLPLHRPGDLPESHLHDGIFIIASEYLAAMAATLQALGAVHLHDATPHIRLYTAL
ncbi:glycosyltransferase family 2 protein [Niveispirillum sp. KHB5.9]|uniref:glycosyltransferase family 2 protein n=1 Tax=Niveispirillum sp. KHB5.9 TaxID=3400269 RepID=UPI003A873923